MALTTRRDADRFARLLDGADVQDAPEALRQLARLAGTIPRPSPVPDPAFKDRLRGQLRAAADERASALVTAPRVQPRPDPPAPRELVLRMPRGLLPGLVAGMLGLAILVGGLSSRALPGDRLYDIKLGIGQAQVRLAGSDLARGRALLRQLDHRVDEVDALVGAGDPRSRDVDVALDQASSDLADAQRVLLASDGRSADSRGLRSLTDASAQAQGRLRALAPLLPTASGPRLRRLLDLLQAGDAVALRQAVACGDACADLRRELEQRISAGPGGLASSGTSGASTGGDSPSASAGQVPATPRVAVLSVPSVPVSQLPRPGQPSATQPPKVSVPGVTVSVPGVGVTVPGLSITTPAGGGPPTLTVPPVGVTLGPITASVSTSGCIIGLGGLCIGG